MSDEKYRRDERENAGDFHALRSLISRIRGGLLKWSDLGATDIAFLLENKILTGFEYRTKGPGDFKCTHRAFQARIRAAAQNPYSNCHFSNIELFRNDPQRSNMCSIFIQYLGSRLGRSRTGTIRIDTIHGMGMPIDEIRGLLEPATEYFRVDGANVGMTPEAWYFFDLLRPLTPRTDIACNGHHVVLVTKIGEHRIDEERSLLFGRLSWQDYYRGRSTDHIASLVVAKLDSAFQEIRHDSLHYNIESQSGPRTEDEHRPIYMADYLLNLIEETNDNAIRIHHFSVNTRDGRMPTLGFVFTAMNGYLLDTWTLKKNNLQGTTRQSEINSAVRAARKYVAWWPK